MQVTLVLLFFLTASLCSIVHEQPEVPNLLEERDEIISALVTRQNVSAYALKYNKNCQGLSFREREAWDAANTLAKAAQLWVPGGRYQKTADFWLGADSKNHADRIKTLFTRVRDFHDPYSFWFGGNAQSSALFELYCRENGPNGRIPQPDEDKTTPFISPCLDGSGSFAWSGHRSRWYWLRKVYQVSICQRTWDLKYTLNAMHTRIANEKKQKDLQIEFGLRLRGATYLHEFTHLEIISNPVVEDVLTKKRTAYGADRSAALARHWGFATKVPDKDGGYNGEFGAGVNAENYILFAASIYLQEHYKAADPVEPADPAWKSITRDEIGPVPQPPRRPHMSNNSTDFHEDDPLAAIFTPDADVSDTEPQLEYPEPPSPPACQAPGSSTAAIDPAVAQSEAQEFCKSFPPDGAIYPAQPPSPLQHEASIDGTNVKITFAFEPIPGEKGVLGCFMGCGELTEKLISTCQFNSHQLSGKSTVGQSCGKYTMEVVEAMQEAPAETGDDCAEC